MGFEMTSDLKIRISGFVCQITRSRAVPRTAFLAGMRSIRDDRQLSLSQRLECKSSLRGTCRNSVRTSTGPMKLKSIGENEI